jgi:glycosyltransferase involved in cell wall biosynthesis
VLSESLWLHQTVVVVAQLGARMNYAVPRVLWRAGMLAHFYTDVYSTAAVTSLFRFLPPAARLVTARRLLGRVAENVPESLITSFPWFGCRYAIRCRSARHATRLTATQLWAGKRFCQLIGESCLKKAKAVYTYNSAGLELLRWAKRSGVFAIVEQTIAPRKIEEELLAGELERFPEWKRTNQKDESVAEYQRREELEWEAADLILCGSDFVRDSIRRCDGPYEKCVVVPYGVDRAVSTSTRVRRAGPLRVLTVGAVGVRKGSPYLLQVARAAKEFASFRAIGPWHFPRQLRSELDRALHLLGPIPRNEITAHYSWADVFLLPSVCEGSATVTYEALAAGLPVICTPNTGSVVRDGLDGFVVPVGDVRAMVELLGALSSDPGLLARLQRNAAARHKDFGVEAYGRRLIQVLTNRAPHIFAHLSGQLASPSEAVHRTRC